jgi:hypothetical protein
MLPWASPFQGLPAPALHELSPALLPRASQRPPKRTPAAPRSISRPMLGLTRLSREGGSGLDEATLLGFGTCAFPNIRAKPLPGLFCSPLVAPFRVFGQESPPRGSLPSRWRPLGISHSFRVPPGEVPCLLVPRSRFAVSHFLGCAVFLRLAALATLSDQCNLSSSSAFLQSLEQSCPSRPAAASQLLSWAFVPYSTPGFGGLPAAGLASAR